METTKKGNKIWAALVKNHLALKDAVYQSRKALSDAFLEYYKNEHKDKIDVLESFLKAEIIGIEHEENHDTYSNEWADTVTLTLNNNTDKIFIAYKSDYFVPNDDEIDLTYFDRLDEKYKDDEEFIPKNIIEILRDIFSSHPDVDVYYS